MAGASHRGREGGAHDGDEASDLHGFLPLAYRSFFVLWILHLSADGFHAVLLIVGGPDFVLTSRRVSKNMGWRQ